MDEIHIWKVLVALGPELPAEILHGIFEGAEMALILLGLGRLIHWDWPRRHPNALAIGLIVYFKTWRNLWAYTLWIIEGSNLKHGAVLTAMLALVCICLPLALLIAALGFHLRLRLLRPSSPPATPG